MVRISRRYPLAHKADPYAKKTTNVGIFIFRISWKESIAASSWGLKSALRYPQHKEPCYTLGKLLIPARPIRWRWRKQQGFKYWFESVTYCPSCQNFHLYFIFIELFRMKLIFIVKRQWLTSGKWNLKWRIFYYCL